MALATARRVVSVTLVLVIATFASVAEPRAAPNADDVIGKALSDVSIPYSSYGPRGKIRCLSAVLPISEANQKKFFCILDFPVTPDRSDFQLNSIQQVGNLLVFGEIVKATDPPIAVEVIRGALALPPIPNQNSLRITTCTLGGTRLDNTVAYFRAEAGGAVTGAELGPVIKVWSFDAKSNAIKEIPASTYLSCSKELSKEY